MMNRNDPVWLITGCSTGFGRELAKLGARTRLARRRHARDPSKVADIAEGHGERALVLPLDVTNRAQIDAIVGEHATLRPHRRARQQRRLRLSRRDRGRRGRRRARDVRDQRVRPRRHDEGRVAGDARAESGLIVNVSSIGGLTSFAATGYYHATKYAVEGHCPESLAIEVKPLGIDVLIVEPGPFRNELGRAVDQAVGDEYRRLRGSTAGEPRREDEGADSVNQAGDTVRAAQAIIDAALSDSPAAAAPPWQDRAGTRAQEARLDARRFRRLGSDYRSAPIFRKTRA